MKAKGYSRKDVATALKTAAAFYLYHYGFSVTFELGVMPWGSRRADVVANKVNGKIVILEVKSSVADFKADKKWQEYLPYCDKLMFCTTEDVYKKIDHLIPKEVGVVCLSESSGWAYMARRCPVREMTVENRVNVLARLAYRQGELSRRTTQGRQRVFIGEVPELMVNHPKARKRRKRKSWAKDKRRSAYATSKSTR